MKKNELFTKRSLTNKPIPQSTFSQKMEVEITFSIKKRAKD